MKAVVLDAETLNPDELDLSCFDALPVDIEWHNATAPEKLVERLQGAQIVFSNKVVLDEAVLRQAPDCQYIGVLATGTNNIDHAYCEKHGITVNNVKAYGTASVVQHTLMLLLNLVTSFSSYSQDVRSGKWQSAAHFCLSDHPVMELAGKHLVILGYGELGEAFARMATALGMRVSVAARPGNADDLRPSLDSLLPEADVLSLHCALSEETQQVINAERLALMKPTAFLLNTARGGLVDEHALLKALENKQIAGAGLDVVSSEPPDESNPLLNTGLPNLLITPHTAWISREARQRILEISAENLKQYLSF